MNEAQLAVLRAELDIARCAFNLSASQNAKVASLYAQRLVGKSELDASNASCGEAARALAEKRLALRVAEQVARNADDAAWQACRLAEIGYPAAARSRAR